MGRQYLLYLLLAALFPTLSLAQVHHFAQAHSSEQVEVSPPPVRRAEAPAADATVAELEAARRHSALRKSSIWTRLITTGRRSQKEPDNARLYNKTGINELQMARFNEARKDFERAIKNDRQFADAYNNLGVIYYLQKKYGKAIKEYEQAIKIAAGFRLIFQQSRGGVFLQERLREGQSGLQPGPAARSGYFRANFAHRSAGADVIAGRPRPFLLRAGQALCQERRDRPLPAIPATRHGRRL